MFLILYSVDGKIYNSGWYGDKSKAESEVRWANTLRDMCNNAPSVPSFWVQESIAIL